MKLIIGLHGKKGSGKSTAAELLCDIGFEELTFAGPLKQACRAIFGLGYEQVYGSLEDKETVDAFWGTTPRKMLQQVGTAIRLLPAPLNNTWVRVLQRNIEEICSINPFISIVISDVRYADEADMIRKLGGFIISLERDECAARLDLHESENQIIEADVNIANNGTIEQLRNNLYEAIQAFASK